MSVWARRVVQTTADEPSFNLRENRELVDFIDSESEAGFYPYLNQYGSGMVDVPLKVLRKAVRMSAKLGLDEQTVKRLQQDIAAAKSGKDESVTYDCS